MYRPTIPELLYGLIQHGPGRTESELAEAIYGSGAYQQQVNQTCQYLRSLELVERHGAGGSVDPYRYFVR